MSEGEYFVHPTAIIDEPCSIGKDTKIWHFCHVMSGARIGERCVLGQNVFIANDVVIGNNVKIQNNVSVYTGVELEDDVFCGPSCVFTNVSNPRSEATYLKERDIGTMIYYPVPLHLQELYTNLGYGEGSLPASEVASREVLSLPMYPELTEEQQVMVAEAIRGFYGLRRTTNPLALRQRSGQAWLRTGVGRSLDTDDG